MYERLKMLYEAGRVTKEMLEVAVGKGWITEQQKNVIIGEVETTTGAAVEVNL